MLFQKQVDRAMKLSTERSERKKNKHGQGKEEEYNTRSWQEEERLSDVMEKGDLLALIISALLVFLPAGMIVILLMCFLGMFPAFF